MRMREETPAQAPSPDVPSLSVRWEGLTVVVDAATLNAVLRHATRRVPEIREILVEPDDGRLTLTVRARSPFKPPLRSEITNLRYRDGWLGFNLEHLTVFGFVPIPAWVLKKIVDRQPPGFAFFYPGERVVVLNLTDLLPPELSLEVRDVICENGEIRLVFGPSHYRLDRLLETLDRGPFDLDGS